MPTSNFMGHRLVLTVHIGWVMECQHAYSAGTNILDMVSPSWVLSFYTKVISSTFPLQSGRPTTGLDIITNTLQATLSKERETQNTTKTQLSLFLNFAYLFLDYIYTFIHLLYYMKLSEWYNSSGRF